MPIVIPFQKALGSQFEWYRPKIKGWLIGAITNKQKITFLWQLQFFSEHVMRCPMMEVMGAIWFTIWNGLWNMENLAKMFFFQKVAPIFNHWSNNIWKSPYVLCRNFLKASLRKQKVWVFVFLCIRNVKKLGVTFWKKTHIFAKYSVFQILFHIVNHMAPNTQHLMPCSEKNWNWQLLVCDGSY